MPVDILKNKIKTKIFLYKNTGNYSRQKIEKMLMMISPEEKERFFKFKFKKDAHLYLFGKILTRKIIGRMAKKNPIEIVFVKNKFGKPRLKYPPIKNFYFNLSHSGKYAVLVLSEKPVGVDIEEIRPIDIKLLSAQLHKKEQDELNSCKNPRKQTEKFFTIWTLKEAYAKAMGRRLSLSVKDFYFKFKGEKIYLGGQRNKNLWYFKTYRPDNSYFLSLCSRYKKSPRLIMLNP